MTVTAPDPVDLTGFTVPGRGKGLLDVFHRRYLLRLLVRKGVSTRYRNSALGWGWSYIKPLTQFFIYFFVMGIVLGLNNGIQNFAVYLLSGIIVVNLFNEAFSNATTSIVDNKALVKKIYLPRELFPIAAGDRRLHPLPAPGRPCSSSCLLVGWIAELPGARRASCSAR